MSRTSARAILDASISEAHFQADIIQTAKDFGWLVYHAYDSRRNTPGFPDLVLVHPERELLVIAELKTEAGRLSRAQQRWLHSLEWLRDWFSDYDTHRSVIVAIWRPRDRKRIDRLLTGGA